VYRRPATGVGIAEIRILGRHLRDDLLTAATRRDLNAKAPTCGVFAEPSDGLEPSTPSLPWNVSGNRWRPVATDFACFCGFEGQPICQRLPPVATTGLHKGSILGSHESDFRCAGPGGIAVSEERQLNGYRVRLRVVEEYDVALLAESPDDAKARAEADVRKGDQFEDIQDSWPEEVISVQALAVEPYPELE
jgi:hypothetical protein